jgi:hypothetical protein
VAVVFSPGERCPARIELSDFQLLWLKRRPYGAHGARRHHECQLEFRHDGPHGSLGQQSEDVEWWIRWTLTSSAIEQVRECSSGHDDIADSTEHHACLLFEGHPGRHSFELEHR